jgi:phage gpG-like protein
MAQTQKLMGLLANDSKNYFVEAFAKQSWDGKAWKQVERKIVGTKAFKYPSKPKSSAHTRPILIGTGKLRRAVSNAKKNGTVGIKRLVLIVSDVSYAAVHNDGLKMRSGGNMPQRRFMGDTKKLREIQIERIKKFTSAAWRA